MSFRCAWIVVLICASASRAELTVQGEIISIDWKSREITVRQPRGTEEKCRFGLDTKVFIDGQEKTPWHLVRGHVVAFSYSINRSDLAPAKDSPVGQINAYVETDPRLLPGKPALRGKVPPKPTLEELAAGEAAAREAAKEIADRPAKAQKPIMTRIGGSPTITPKQPRPKKAKPDPAPCPPADSKAEAARKLKFAKQYLTEARNQNDSKEADRLTELARKHLQEIADKFADTPSATEAKKLLDGL